jgi:hypothetical protein
MDIHFAMKLPREKALKWHDYVSERIDSLMCGYPTKGEAAAVTYLPGVFINKLVGGKIMVGVFIAPQTYDRNLRDPPMDDNYFMAARWIRKQEPQLLIIGVPVAPQDVVGLLTAEADHVEVITSPSTYKFTTIECFYEEFRPITD